MESEAESRKSYGFKMQGPNFMDLKSQSPIDTKNTTIGIKLTGEYTQLFDSELQLRKTLSRFRLQWQ